MVKGTKRALLVGCHYYNTYYEKEQGCGKDVQMIQDLLTKSLCFEEENIKILMETKSHDLTNQPTKKNIEKELKNMMEMAEEGDVLFFYFSGWGKRDEGSNSPAIMSCKLESFTAVEFRTLVDNQKLPEDASFTFVCEASNSGDFLLKPVQPNDNRIVLSACRTNEKRSRRGENLSTNYGLFTKAIEEAFDNLPAPVTNIKLLNHVTKRVERFGQHPCLVCNKNNEEQPFSGYLINNSN